MTTHECATRRERWLAHNIRVSAWQGEPIPADIFIEALNSGMDPEGIYEDTLLEAEGGDDEWLK